MSSIAPHDTSPYSVARPPFPNMVNSLNRRVEQHVLNFTGANGSVTFNAAASSPGCGIAYVSEGLYTITFPPGGTDCLGWVVPGAVESTTADATIPRAFSIDSNAGLGSFALGGVGLVSVDFAATPVISDVIGTVSLLINIVKDPTP
jgi:hypothetical protein